MSENKRDYLESAIFQLSLTNPFYSALLQELTVKFSPIIPLAALIYDKKNTEFSIYLNPDKFCEFPLEQRTSILFHEILHFTHSHIFRMPKKDDIEQDKLQNIAMDMAINQYIKGLPPKCIDVKRFKLNDGNPFPLFETAENYYDLLNQNQQNNKDELAKYKTKGKPGSSNGQEGDSVDDSSVLDEHDWEEMSDEEKNNMLKDAEKLIKRTIEKTSNLHSDIPAAIKDLLEQIDAKVTGISYKQILMRAIKKTVSSFQRRNTWSKPNKRYGKYSPGTTSAKFPKINVYIDSSGSMSHTELNQSLNILNGFLKAGDKKCNLGLWHTNLYYFKSFKYNNEITEDMLESGGTDVTGVMEHIAKTIPNLSIICTDGYYDRVDKKITSDIIWIILEGGNENHPMKNIGKTIYMKGLKNE